MSPRKRRFGEKLRSLYLWHRYAGLAAALLAGWLAITGLLLNHTEDFDLAGRFVGQPWLLSLYGIEPAAQVHGQRIGTHWLAGSGNRVYLDGRFIGSGKAVGAAASDSGLVVAFSDRLQVYAPGGELIEELPFTATTAPITGVTATSEGIVIAAGAERFLSDADFLNIVPLATADAVPKPGRELLPAHLAEEISADVLRHSLTWERVLLDMHAGRIFGLAGVWLADAAGLLLLWLAVSGIIVWLQRRGARGGRR